MRDEATRTVDTLVVGAGISGLAYAHYRSAEDAEEVLVLDASERPGGLIDTVTVDGPVALRYEAGPETISDPAGVAEALLDELGLERVRAAATKRFLVSRGAVVEIPSAPPALLASSLLPLGARLRMLTEPFRKKGVALDGSIADFVRHRLGRGVLETLVDPMIAGIHAASPEDLSFRACFPRFADGVAEHGTLVGFLKSRRGAARAGDRNPWKPDGGMHELPRALARRLGDALQLGTAVRSLTRVTDPLDGSAWEARTSRGAVRARRVVLALPLRATERLLADAAPDAGALLSGMGAEGIVVVAHAYRRADVAHALDGFGYLVPSKEGLKHLGTLFPSALDPASVPDDVVLLRTMLGGARDPAALDATDDESLACVRDEVGGLLGIGAPPLFAAVHRWPGALPRFDLGHPDRLERLDATLPDDLTLLGNHQRGIGLSSLLAESRRLAAEHEAAGSDREAVRRGRGEPQRVSVV